MRLTKAHPRVLIVSHDYAEAGLRRQLEAYARLFDVRFVTPHRSTALVFADHRAKADSLTRVYPRLGLFGHQYWLRSTSLGLGEFRPDLVYVTYDPWSAIFFQVLAVVATHAPRAQIVCGAKKNTYRRYPGVRGRVKDTFARIGLGRTDHVIAASEMTADLYRQVHGVASEDISVAPRVGVDTKTFCPSPRHPRNRPLIVGYCGRLAEHKGVTDLVQAVASARGRGAELELELLGAGELRESLMSRARSQPWLRIRDAVPSDHVACFMQSIDLYVLPARVLDDHEEHDAHALLQALACGLPTIGTASGIIPEILNDPNDVVVAPNDSEALAIAIADLSNDPDRRDRLAIRGRHVAQERYSFERVAASYAGIFSALYEGRRPGGPSIRALDANA